MYVLKASELFRTDLDHLPKDVINQVRDKFRLLERSPKHPSLQTHKVDCSPKGRRIMESYIDETTYRILWEYLSGYEIGLWRVGLHEVIDAARRLPPIPKEVWQHVRKPSPSVAEQGTSVQSENFGPFRHVDNTFLRILGVPDDALAEVRALVDEEKIWDLHISENIKYTLYDIWSKRELWTVDDLLDSQQLLYRSTADQLEGYCEGRIKRLLLNLSPEQERLVNYEPNGPLLIKGAAGSGKTTVGLYRAKRLSEVRSLFGGDADILILTYTVTLKRALEELLDELYGERPANLRVSTFRDWGLAYLYPDLEDNSYPLINDSRNQHPRENMVAQAMRRVRGMSSVGQYVTRLGSRFCLGEIDNVIKARGVSQEQEYRAIERIGQDAGLRRDFERPAVWQVYLDYQRQMDERGLIAYSDIPIRVLERLQNDPNPPDFDAVIVDEAQDLTPVTLRAIRNLVKERTSGKGLTLLADPAQSIYYMGIPWKDAGIGVTGARSKPLQKNFRNTQQILRAAKSILDRCEDLKRSKEYIEPTASQRYGPKPLVVTYESLTDEYEFIVEQILELCQHHQYRPGDFVVLARTRDELPGIRKHLRTAKIPARSFKEDEFQVLENEVKLITMHSAKGLEYPVVFLINLEDGKLPNRNATQDAEEFDRNDHSPLLERERKLLYVSMTRASDRLFLLRPRRNLCPFIRDIDSSEVTCMDTSKNE